MYCLLAGQQAVRERRDQRAHPVYARPQLMTQAPNQLWSWDITDLGIEASFSRPRQSNDNPFSESLFKTTKCAPAFPACFAGMHHTREVITPFFEHYNHHHRRSAIGLMTPANVHCGDAPRITAERAVTLQSAFDRHQHRFKGRTPQPPRVPDKVYTNPPQPETLPDPSSGTETH